MDRNMPGELDGVRALNRMRGAGITGLKVIMCTSTSLTREVEEAYAAGAMDYVLKPIDVDKLLDKVKRVLASPKP
jgi:CheY-like chemotaxis protein